MERNDHVVDAIEYLKKARGLSHRGAYIQLEIDLDLKGFEEKAIEAAYRKRRHAR